MKIEEIRLVPLILLLVLLVSSTIHAKETTVLDSLTLIKTANNQHVSGFCY